MPLPSSTNMSPFWGHPNALGSTSSQISWGHLLVIMISRWLFNPHEEFFFSCHSKSRASDCVALLVHSLWSIDMAASSSPVALSDLHNQKTTWRSQETWDARISQFLYSPENIGSLLLPMSLPQSWCSELSWFPQQQFFNSLQKAFFLHWGKDGSEQWRGVETIYIILQGKS